MDELLNGKSIKADFEAQVTAALMIQSNALIPLKLAARLCGIPKHEILRRIDCGTFPKPRTLSVSVWQSHLALRKVPWK